MVILSLSGRPVVWSHATHRILCFERPARCNTTPTVVASGLSSIIKGRRGSYFRAALPVLLMADLTPAAGCDLGTTRGLLSPKSRAGRRSYFASAHRCLRPRAASGGLLSFANRKCAGLGIWCG